MKIRVLFFVCFTFCLVFAGCAAVKEVLPLPKPQRQPIYPAYNGPKAKITLADFDVKAAKATAEVCADLRRHMLSALSDSGRFRLIDRQQSGAVLAASNVSGLVSSLVPLALGWVAERYNLQVTMWLLLLGPVALLLGLPRNSGRSATERE